MPMDPKLTYPRVYIRNSALLMCQILRTPREEKEFAEIDPDNRRMISDWVNFKAFQKGQAPFNQNGTAFAIKASLYKAYTGQSVGI